MKPIRQAWHAARVPLPLLALAVALIWWRGPDWGVVRDAFAGRELAVDRRGGRAQPALGGRARARLEHRDPPGDAAAAPALPARVRGVLRRPLRERRAARPRRRARARRRADAAAARTAGTIWATLIGSVFAHRAFDIFPATVLVVWVLFTAEAARTGR